MTVTSSPPPPPAKRGWTVSRIVQLVAGLVVTVVGALVLIGNLMTRNDLPDCDSTRAKDTLSDIFKKNEVNAARYDEIKRLTKADDEVTCHAKLTLRDGGKLEIDYKLLREGADMTLRITRSSL
jgi:hypothetical protein